MTSVSCTHNHVKFNFSSYNRGVVEISETVNGTIIHTDDKLNIWRRRKFLEKVVFRVGGIGHTFPQPRP